LNILAKGLKVSAKIEREQALLASIEIICFSNVKSAKLANDLVRSAAVYYHYHLVLVVTISSSVA
jgi:hypothetical protein